MICLTGDVHHMSLCTGNQLASDIPESITAQRMLSLLEDHDIKVTYFISGKCFLEEWEHVRPICEHPLVEIGGHNWSCFQPQILHRITNKLFGSYNGPEWMQRRDARKTIRIIREKTGRTIRSWRNHQYMHGPFTESALRAEGIEIISDGVVKEGSGPVRHETGVFNFPLNVIPDHEHLFHAERTPKWVAWWRERYDWSDDFGPDSYFIHEWADLVLDCLARNEERGAISNLIIHPITMYLCDGFHALRKILRFIADRKTVWISETLHATEVEKVEVTV